MARRLGIRDPEHRTRLLGDTTMRTRDGVRLRTLHFGPAGGGRHPAVLIRTPYGIGWSFPLGIMPPLARFLARRGYHVVLQDTRGRYGSEGSFYPFTHEAEDGRDALEWVSKQSWFDGRLGMWGASYFGYTQWSVAVDPPSYLRAIVPIVTSTDLHGLFYPGGAFSLTSALRWATANGDRRGRRPPERRLPAAARERPMREAAAAAGYPAQFYADWVDHPERDGYWANINQLDARERSRVPALLVAGTYDIFCGPQLADYAALRDSAQLDLGPTAHSGYAISRRKLGWRRAGVLDAVTGTIGFLDHHLQGRPLERGRVRRYIQGDDRWEMSDDWPPPEARLTRLYLRSRGRLEREAPGGDEAPDRFTYAPEEPVPTRGGTFMGPRCGPADQRPLESRADVMRYETPPLERGLELAGPVRLALFASSDAPATDFTGKLVHVPADPARPALNLCEGIARLPGGPDPASAIDVDLWHASARIPAGDRLRLEVSSSNFPRFDAHPNLPGNPGHARDTRPARQTIHHARDAPSSLLLYTV